MNTVLILAALATTSATDFQSSLDKIRLDQQVPGVSAVVTRKDKILFAGASGVADLETERAMTADTVLYAGSLSKILTAVLTLNLAESGKLSLDDVVPGIAAKSRQENGGISVKHLLTHASGLDREGDFGYWFSADFPDKSALGRYLLNTNLRTSPGTSFHYSNVGYAALGPVVEQASGQTFNNALASRVFKPLGMESSGTLNPGDDLAAGYSPVNRLLPNQEKPFAGIGRRVGNRHVREYHNANAMTPAFGAFTTARDLSRIARFLLGYGDNDVLSDDMRSQMLTAQTSGWGLGIKVGKYKRRPIASHAGWFAAHQSHLFLDLRSGIAVVVMTNSDSASPGKIAEALFDVILQSDP